MKVYRLEKDGIGPYTHKELCEVGRELQNELHTAHSGSDYPGWIEEFGRELPDNYRKYLAGCAGMGELQTWFGDFLEEFIAVGFEIVCYETKKFLKSYQQVMFIPYKKVIESNYSQKVLEFMLD